MSREAAVVLLWNPDQGTQVDTDEIAYQIGFSLDGCSICEWSVGRRTTLEAGTPFWLFRQGKGRRGIVGRGVIASEPDGDGESETRWADVAFTAILPPEQMLPVETLLEEAPSGRWNNRYQSGQSIPADAHEIVSRLWERWICSSDQPGHNVDPRAAAETVKDTPPEAGTFLRRIGHFVDVEVGDERRVYWTHNAADIERAAWQHGPARSFGGFSVPIHIWRDRLLGIDGPDGKSILFSLAHKGEAKACDRTSRIGGCPNCGGKEVQDLLMGMPDGSVWDDPNYAIGGCVVGGGEPAYVCSTCEHGWGSRW